MIALIFGFLAWAFAVLYVSDSLGLWAGIFLCVLTAAALNEVGKELVRQLEEMKWTKTS